MSGADRAADPVELDAALGQAFMVAAAELGMSTAAWLFTREVAATGGAPLVERLRDHLGRDFPVLDAVCGGWLRGQRGPRVVLDGVLAACRGARRVLVVGVEVEFLDALVPRLEAEAIGLLTYAELEPDWARLLANFGGRVEPCGLDSFQRYAGAQGVVLTFVYGARAATAHVSPAWLRVVAGDVRAQFRSLIGWDVLGDEMFVYPRWLVQTPTSDFSHLV